jgi:hypothetical protein
MQRRRQRAGDKTFDNSMLHRDTILVFSGRTPSNAGISAYLFERYTILMIQSCGRASSDFL